jgi:GT2 family glycosyltransferase
VSRPVISVVIVNYNGSRWLRPCLDALRGQREAPTFDVLVVDNGSTDASVSLVGRDYPEVSVVASAKNVGFAEGNNLGARAASGDWLVFLNNDTVAEPDWLAKLAAASCSRPEFQIFTSRIVFLDDPSRIDSAGDGYYRAGGAFKSGHGQPAESRAVSEEVFGACGAAMMIRGELFHALGGFDSRFFMVYEDVDLSYRARLGGARVWYAADAVVRHAGSASIGTLSAATVYYGQRNLEWAWIKNTPPRLFLATALAHAVYSAAGVLYYVRAGRAWPAVRGKIDALRGLRAVLAERRRVQRTRTADDDCIDRAMRRHWVSDKRREKASDAIRASRLDDPS